MDDTRPQESRPKVLIVDDNKANLYALDALLETEGIEVHKAMSGKAAIDLAELNDYALILLDVQMPEMDGYETALYLRSHTNTQYIPIILVSAIYKALQVTQAHIHCHMVLCG